MLRTIPKIVRLSLFLRIINKVIIIIHNYDITVKNNYNSITFLEIVMATANNVTMYINIYINT